MKYIKLTLKSKDQSRKDLPLYVPDNWFQLVKPPFANAKEGEEFLKKLVVGFDDKNCFSHAPREGFYICSFTGVHRNGKDFHIRVQNLGDAEDVAIKSPRHKAFDLKAIDLDKASVTVSVEEITCEKSIFEFAEQERVRIGKIVGAERLTLFAQKHVEKVRLGKAAQQKRQEDAEAQLRAEAEKEREREQVEKMLIAQEKRVKAHILGASQSRSDAVATVTERKAQPSESTQNEALALLVPRELQSNREVKAIIDELEGPVAFVLGKEAFVQKPYDGISGVQFGEQVSPLQRSVKIQIREKIAGALKKAKDEMDHEADYLAGLAAEARKKMEAELDKRHATVEEFRAIIQEIIKQYNAKITKGKISDGRQEEIVSQLTAAYQAGLGRTGLLVTASPSPLDSALGSVKGTPSPLVAFIQVRYKEERLKQAERLLDDPLKRNAENANVYARAVIARLIKSADQVQEELKAYASEVSRFDKAVYQLNENARYRHEGFKRLLGKVAEAEAVVHSNYPGLDTLSRLTLAERAVCEKFLQETASASSPGKKQELTKAFEKEVRDFYRHCEYSEAEMEAWGQKWDEHQGLKAAEQGATDYMLALHTIAQREREGVTLRGYAREVKGFREEAIQAGQSIGEWAQAVQEESLKTKIHALQAEVQEGGKQLATAEAQIPRTLSVATAFSSRNACEEVRQQNVQRLNKARDLKELDKFYQDVKKFCLENKIPVPSLEKVQAIAEAQRKVIIENLGHYLNAIELCRETNTKIPELEDVKDYTPDAWKNLVLQLQLLKTLIKVVEQVPFWNDQVTGFTGPKVQYMDPKTGKPASLRVPDGVGNLANNVVRNEKLSVQDKLALSDQTVSERLGPKGYNAEKPFLRRQPTHDFYTTWKKQRMPELESSPDALEELDLQLKTFVASKIEKKIGARGEANLVRFYRNKAKQEAEGRRLGGVEQKQTPSPKGKGAAK